MLRGPAALAAVLLVTPLLAQQQAVFDAASVKRNTTGLPGGVMDFRAGGQFSATNETLLQLLRAAFDVDTYRVVGGPEWLNRARFDVQARAAAGVTRDETRAMLRALLAERFALKARRETRTLPTYDLTLARRGGPAAAGLRAALPSGCVDRGPQPGRVPAGELPSCGLLPTGPERMSGRGVTLDLLATQLSSITGRVVRDRTGLAGLFDIDLEWAMSEATAQALAAFTPDNPPVANPNRPGLFTAIDEQLGLKLESTTGPVDVVIIESATLPLEN